MGYGNGIVDWGMQSAHLETNPNAGQNGYDKAYVNKFAAEFSETYDAAHKKKIAELKAAHDKDIKKWRDAAIEIQHGLDQWTTASWSWKDTALSLREQYAPHLTPDDILAQYKKVFPVMEKKYYKEFVKDRTWDK